jgi:plastocyanin
VRTFYLSLPLVLALVMTGCGGEDPKPSSDPVEEDPIEEIDETEPAAAPTATIKGVVKFEGKAPRRRKLDMGAEPFCESHKDKDLRDESVIVNDDGTLRNVFVWIKKGVKGKFPMPAEPVVIKQVNCQYTPHIVGVRVGQPVVIENEDPLMHNVHGLGKRNKEFNYAQAKKGMKNEEIFRRPEVMLELKCDVHGWMGAYIGIVRHPFFAVTGDGGTFELGKLPPGDYTIEAWHEVYGTKPEKVTLGDNETRDISFTFSKQP